MDRIREDILLKASKTILVGTLMSELYRDNRDEHFAMPNVFSAVASALKDGVIKRNGKSVETTKAGFKVLDYYNQTQETDGDYIETIEPVINSRADANYFYGVCR